MLVWLATFVLLLRVVVVGLPLATAFVVVTALTAGTIEHEHWRVLLGLAVCVGMPLVVRWRLAAFVQQRRGEGKYTPPSVAFFVALGNIVITCALVLGFADDVGRALRRHGDWFVGERNGAVARRVRASVGFAAMYLESFDPLPELAPVVLSLPPPPPPRPGEPPPPALPVVALWFHPLAGPERALPGYAIRRFGARRDVIRPPECELGHCGVDIGSTIGEPVFAVFDGVVDRVQRNPDADPISGIFVIISHKQGSVRSRYIHLDSVREDLAPGATVHGGEMIGRLGRTGVHNSGPHLHFGLSVRQGGRERFIDPEPYLRTWQLVEPGERRFVARR